MKAIETETMRELKIQLADAQIKLKDELLEEYRDQLAEAKRLLNKIHRQRELAKGNNMTEQRYYKTTEAARYMGISEHALRKYARDRIIAFSRPGGRDMIFDKEEMDRFILDSREG